MKTALTPLVEKINYLLLNTKSDTDFQRGFVSCLEDLHDFINREKLLATEKQQIIDAHIGGQKFAFDNNLPDSEEYYTETYKP